MPISFSYIYVSNTDYSVPSSIVIPSMAELSCVLVMKLEVLGMSEVYANIPFFACSDAEYHFDVDGSKFHMAVLDIPI